MDSSALNTTLPNPPAAGYVWPLGGGILIAFFVVVVLLRVAVLLHKPQDHSELHRTAPAGIELQNVGQGSQGNAGPRDSPDFFNPRLFRDPEVRAAGSEERRQEHADEGLVDAGRASDGDLGSLRLQPSLIESHFAQPEHIGREFI